MVPKDRHGYGYIAGMFDGHIYLIDPIAGTGVPAYDCEDVTPHVDTPVAGGMGQILATPQSGDRLIFGLFMAGQIGMLDITDRHNPKQLSVVSFGAFTGPHNIVLSSDDRRLVVTDYFLNEDDAGIIHFEGDHKIHVLKVTARHTLGGHPVSTRLQHGLCYRPGETPRPSNEIALGATATGSPFVPPRRGNSRPWIVAALGIAAIVCVAYIAGRSSRASVVHEDAIARSALLHRSDAPGLPLRAPGKSAGLWNGSSTGIRRLDTPSSSRHRVRIRGVNC